MHLYTPPSWSAILVRHRQSNCEESVFLNVKKSALRKTKPHHRSLAFSDTGRACTLMLLLQNHEGVVIKIQKQLGQTLSPSLHVCGLQATLLLNMSRTLVE